MDPQVRTDYAGLLAKLVEGGDLAPSAAEHVRRLLARGAPELLAETAHELLRRLLRSGRLELREGDPTDPAAALAAADPRQGRILRLPALPGAARGYLAPSLDPQTGAPAEFEASDLWNLIQALSRHALAGVEAAADLRAMVVAVLDLTRDQLECPTALAFSRGLPLPPGIARGSREAIFRESPPPSPSPDAEAPPPALPTAWSLWAARALELPDRCLHLHDFARLPAEEQPARRGSALLVPLTPPGAAARLILVAVSPEPGWFHEGRVARVRQLVPHLRRLLQHSLGLQAVVAHDFLTGIYNRAHFEDQLARALADAGRHEQRFALLIVDIDDFRRVNSRYGYDAGDAALKAVCDRLGHALRSTDVLARYGGEEFAVLLGSHPSAAEAHLIGERLRGAVAAQEVEIPTLGGGRLAIRVTVSIGGALFPLHGRDRDALWGEANRMLLAAKAEGKNRVRFRWDPLHEKDAPREA